jgi:hypothetical protein
MEITGAAAAMETNVHTSAEDETGAAGYDVSDAGVLAFAPPSGWGSRLSRLTFVDRNDNREDLPLGPRRFGKAALSPDGKRIAAQINDVDGTHIWIVSVDRDQSQRLTTSGRIRLLSGPKTAARSTSRRRRTVSTTSGGAPRTSALRRRRSSKPRAPSSPTRCPATAGGCTTR